MRSTNENEEGLRVARAWAQWHIGDASYANDIIYAYENPSNALEMLKEDKK